MSGLTAVMFAGGLVGVGVYLMITGLSPAKAPLHIALGRLGEPVPEVVAAATDSIDVRVGRLARKIGPIDRALIPMRPDLRILHRSPEEQAAMILTYTLLGVVFAPIVAFGGLVVSVKLPFVIPLWAALGGGVLGLVITLKSVKPAAMKRRRAFSHALSAFCDVCGMSLASGRGVESSIEAAAHSGTGWPFAELQSALRAGYVRGETPWDALARLGDEADLSDLSELAAAISLAGDQGAAVRETVGSKAKSIRERLTSETERSAASTTERMGIPATFLLFGFILFLGFPAIAVLFK